MFFHCCLHIYIYIYLLIILLKELNPNLHLNLYLTFTCIFILIYLISIDKKQIPELDLNLNLCTAHVSENGLAISPSEIIGTLKIETVDRHPHRHVGLVRSICVKMLFIPYLFKGTLKRGHWELASPTQAPRPNAMSILALTTLPQRYRKKSSLHETREKVAYQA